MPSRPAASEGDGFAVPDSLLRLAEAEQSKTAEPLEAPEVIPEAPAELPPVAASGRLLAIGGAVAGCLTAPVAVRLGLGNVEHSLHAGGSGVAAALVIAVGLALAVAPLLGVAVDRATARVTGLAIAATGLAGGIVTAVAPDVPVLAIGLAASAGAAALAGLAGVAAVGSAPPAARARLLATIGLGVPAATTIGLLIATATGWRLGAVIGALATLPLALLSRTHVPRAAGAEDERPGLGAVSQRLRRLGSFPALITAASTLAWVAVGAPLLVASYGHHRWGLDAAGRGHLLFLAGLGAVVGVPLSALLADRAAARGPRALANLLTALIGAAAAAVVLTGAAPRLGVVDVTLPVAAGLFAGAAGTLVVAVLAVSPGTGATGATTTGATTPGATSPGATGATTVGLVAAYGVAFGGVLATPILAAMGSSNGPRSAVLAAGVAGLAAAGIVRWGTTAFRNDAAAAGRSERLAPAAGQPAALAVHGVDFSYGARQVLFDISLAVDEGEVLALLGTNGAGKSTLLRLVAGLDHPSAGTVSQFGRPTTYVEAEQLIRLGTALLAGGKMSFPGLTVTENLRIGGHSIRRDGPRLRAAMDEVMTLFPVLGERRDQRVGTLSGGEQQMLALGRVLVTRPRLLLIDELSLGLSPKAVEGLLAIVRRLHDEGTTIVMVEQSVNVALTLADRAVFLERGEVRFDGPTRELLTRDDLLRPVFLSKAP
jgi:ABC-type branched-subunit amino acid transport system ATPase component/predicted MFS family arabinose efflux permease